jgi:hypothetical protein
MGAGSSRSLIGKITKVILGRSNTSGQMPRDTGRDVKPEPKSGTKVTGYNVGHKGGGRKKS